MPPSPSLHRRSWCPAPPPRYARRTYPKACNALDSFPHFFGWATTSDQRGPQVLGSVERPRSASSQRYVRDEAELRRHHDTVAASLEGAADEFLVRVWAVHLQSGGAMARTGLRMMPTSPS